ncbi:hypothetical protein [Frankia sp. R82]|uniref:GAP1-N2 domain-containing protein n=1 Tax=Frankia sp. R82 TaxID=2950553 RepID=UPI002044C85F|nr:hypothetical protein [Frankia sp. R82]MCM3882662.1 hypothetical protein [Frankia sp. R82]
MIYQLHHTSAASSNRPGWRVTASTPGLDDSTREQVTALLAAELATSARRTGPQRQTAETSRVQRRSAPQNTPGVVLSYSRLENGAAVICRTVDIGDEFAGRPGNVLQHALLLTEPEQDLGRHLPADLAWWPGWADRPSHGVLPVVNRLALDLSRPRAAAINRARDLHREGRLAPLLDGVRRAALGQGAVRVVLVEPDPAAMIDLIRLATGSLPRERALAMTFAVQVGQPEQSRHVLNVVPHSAGIDAHAVPFGVRFETHDLHASARSELPAGPWGVVAAQVWQVGRVEVLASVSASFRAADADAARHLVEVAARAGIPLNRPTRHSGPPGEVDLLTPAAPRADASARRAGPQPRRPRWSLSGSWQPWTGRLQSAGATTSSHARGALLFVFGMVSAFSRLGGRLLVLPPRTLAAGPPVLRPAENEVAYPAYYGHNGQAAADLSAVRAATQDTVLTARATFPLAGPTRWPGPLRGGIGPGRPETLVRPTGPVGRDTRMWQAGTSAGVTMATGLGRVVLAVYAAFVLTTVALFTAAGTGLRLLESVRWFLRETRPQLTLATLRLAAERGVDCPYPDCARPLRRPFYQCSNPSCGRRHDDLWPGQGGLLYRVCACETRLRTWASGRGGHLASFCGSCSGRLPDGVGHVPIVHIALVGPPASGKTTYLVAALAGLRDLASAGDLAMSFAFRTDEEWYQRSMRILANGGQLESTPTPNPRALVVTVGVRRGPRRIVFFFDPDGRLYTDQETLRTTHRYLERTHNALLVVDPAAQPALLERLSPAQLDTALEVARPAAEPTFDTMRRLIRVLEADRTLPRRGGRISLRLAVVISKTDWLRQLPPGLQLPPFAPEYQDAAVRQWLSGPAHLRELALQPAQEFTDTRYWALSSVDCFHLHPHPHPHAPTRSGQGMGVEHSFQRRTHDGVQPDGQSDPPDGQLNPAARIAATEPVLWMLSAHSRRFRHLVTRQQNQRPTGPRPAANALPYPTGTRGTGQ